MKRKSFIKKAVSGLGALSLLPLAGVAKKESTYDQLMDQVGFNHLPNEEIKTMKTILHKSDTRGHANHGWLDTYHTFSFANYHNPERMHFGVLRVLNDDKVAGGKGFGTHPHDNMEIISIPLEGSLEHKDSMGNTHIIKKGDVQVMSAGTGIYHSEFNKQADSDVRFLQIWVFPNKKNVTPRYDQITFDAAERKNKFQQILSPNPDDAGVWIHQNAWFHLADLDQDKELTYTLKSSENGVYLFVLEGDVVVEDQILAKRDGIGVWESESMKIKATSFAEILLLEVPMSLNHIK